MCPTKIQVFTDIINQNSHKDHLLYNNLLQISDVRLSDKIMSLKSCKCK